MTPGLLRATAIVASSVVHAFAFPPWEQSWLAWVSLVPFLLALRDLTPRRAFAAGWLWGTLAIWVVAHWVPPALMFYYQQPWWFALLFCIVGSQVLWGTYYAAFGWAACHIMRRWKGLPRVTLLSCAWVAAELARSRLLTGEPWMLLGYGLIPETTMIQIADIGSVYLLSFVVFFVNAALAEWVAVCIPVSTPPCSPPLARGDGPGLIPPPYEGGGQGEVEDAATRPDPRQPEQSSRAASAPLCSPLLARGDGPGRVALLTAAALVACTWLYGSWRMATPFQGETTTRVAVIQGNVAAGSQWRRELYAKGLREYLDMSRAAAEAYAPDLIVWPESAVTFFLAEEPLFQRHIRDMLAETGAELVLGGPHAELGDVALPRYFNSGFSMNADGITGRYDKAHLLPFGEYFPLKMIEFLRRRFERVRTFTPGSGEVLLDTPAGRSGVVICFEAIFPEKVRRQMNRGAELLINLTNDVWLGDAAGPRQHASMVVLRAVENRTWVIRATTTGVSAIVDPYGHIVTQSGTAVPATLHASVSPTRATTIYKVLGDLFANICAAITGVALLLALAGATSPNN